MDEREKVLEYLVVGQGRGMRIARWQSMWEFGGVDGSPFKPLYFSFIMELLLPCELCQTWSVEPYYLSMFSLVISLLWLYFLSCVFNVWDLMVSHGPGWGLSFPDSDIDVQVLAKWKVMSSVKSNVSGVNLGLSFYRQWRSINGYCTKKMEIHGYW